MTQIAPACGSRIPPEYEQMALSKATRITMIALGLIAMVIGILILCKVPVLVQAGNGWGYGLDAAGALMIIIAYAIQCVRAKQEAHQNHAPAILFKAKVMPPQEVGTNSTSLVS